MLTIQEVGLEILQNHPRSFYIFGGSEFGIKQKYIDILTSHYGNYTEVSQVNDIIELMQSKRLIPLKPTVYVVRYDEKFLSGLTPVVASKLLNLKIIGTLVLIYEQDTHINKCDKYFPNNTISIDKVDTKFIVKYLMSDFPNISPNVLQIVARSAADYGHAQKICLGLSKLHDSNEISAWPESKIRQLFGLDQTYSEQLLKLNVASRNYAGLLTLVEEYSDNLDNFLYAILATLVELEKLKCNSYTTSPLREYAKLWTLKDIYNMFNHTYSALQQLRSITSNTSNMLIYLISLVVFQEIPDIEVMK